MKKHKICIVGGGLTGLISALVLNERGLDIDLIVENSVSKIKDLRVTAISEKNIDFLRKFYLENCLYKRYTRRKKRRKKRREGKLERGLYS